MQTKPELRARLREIERSITDFNFAIITTPGRHPYFRILTAQVSNLKAERRQIRNLLKEA
jgi:hypothetical protein